MRRLPLYLLPLWPILLTSRWCLARAQNEATLGWLASIFAAYQCAVNLPEPYGKAAPIIIAWYGALFFLSTFRPWLGLYLADD